jgi:hypothetical protein
VERCKIAIVNSRIYRRKKKIIGTKDRETLIASRNRERKSKY